MNMEDVPQWALSKRADDNIVIFRKRAEKEDFISALMRDAAGVIVEFTEEGQVAFKVGENSIVNVKGATKIFNFLRSNINVVTTLTNWTENEINIRTRQVMEAFTVFAYTDFREIGIEKSYIPILIEGLMTSIKAQLNMAKNGMENMRISSYQSEQRHILQEQKKKGLFNFGKKEEEGAQQ